MSILEFVHATPQEEGASTYLSLAEMLHPRIVSDQSIFRHVSSSVPGSALRRVGWDVKWRGLPASSSADVVIGRASRGFLASVTQHRSIQPHHNSVVLCINERPCQTRGCSPSVPEEESRRSVTWNVGLVVGRGAGGLSTGGARAEARQGGDMQRGTLLAQRSVTLRLSSSVCGKCHEPHQVG